MKDPKSPPFSSQHPAFVPARCCAEGHGVSYDDKRQYRRGPSAEVRYAERNASRRNAGALFLRRHTKHC